MLKDLLKEGSLYSVSSLLTKGISLLLIPFYTAYFSPEDYGVIDILSVFGAFFNVIVSLQLNQALARYVAEPTLKETSKVKYASTAVWTVVSLYILFTVIIVFNASFFSGLISSKEFKIDNDVFIAAVVSMFFSGIFYFLSVHLRYIRKVKEVTILSFINALLAIFLTIVLVLFYDQGVLGVFYATIISNAVAVFSQIIILRGKVIWYFNVKVLQLLLRFSLPLLPAALAYISMNFTDRIFIKEFLSFSELGIYGIASKFSSIISIVIIGFSAAIVPLIIEKHISPKTKVELSKIFKYYIGVGTFILLMLSLFSKETLILFTNEKFYAAASVLPILYGVAYIGGINMFSPGLIIQKKTGIIAALMITFFIVNMVLNYFLIQSHGIVGATVATLVSTFLYEAFNFYFSQKVYTYKVDMFKIIMVSLLCILFLGFGYYSLQLTTNVSLLLRVIVLALYFLILYKMDFLTFIRNEKNN